MTSDEENKLIFFAAAFALHIRLDDDDDDDDDADSFLFG
jgi:hypothetical protein